MAKRSGWPYFYSSSIRRLLIAFMTTFSDIKVRRYDDSGLKTAEHYKEILVPIKFGPMSKYFQRRTEDASGQRYYIQLPAMAVTFSSFSFDAERSTSSRQRRFLLDPKKYNSPADFLTDMMPSPWDINFTLAIKTESFQDFCQIIEQIVPWFNPAIHIKVKEFETVNLERDIEVILNGMNTDITEEVEEDGKRYVSGSLEFTAKAWMYKPISMADNMIKVIHTHYGMDPEFNVQGENFVTRGMKLEEAEDKKKWPMKPARTRGEVDRMDVENSPVDLPEMGYVNDQTEDGTPAHVPYNVEVKPDEAEMNFEAEDGKGETNG